MMGQLPNPTIPEFGLWIIGAAGLLVIVVMVLTALVRIKDLTKKPRRQRPPPGTEYITRAELERFVTASQTEIRELTGYCRDRFHELGDKLQAVANQMAAQPGRQREIVDAALAPIIAKLDHLTIEVAKLLGQQSKTTTTTNSKT